MAERAVLSPTPGLAVRVDQRLVVVTTVACEFRVVDQVMFAPWPRFRIVVVVYRHREKSLVGQVLLLRALGLLLTRWCLVHRACTRS